MSDKLQSAEGFAADLWNSSPGYKGSTYEDGWIAEVIPDIKERDRQQFEAGRQQGWRERGKADKKRLLEATQGSYGEKYSSCSVIDLGDMPPPAAPPASEPAKEDKHG